MLSSAVNRRLIASPRKTFWWLDPTYMDEAGLKELIAAKLRLWDFAEELELLLRAFLMMSKRGGVPLRLIGDVHAKYPERCGHAFRASRATVVAWIESEDFNRFLSFGIMVAPFPWDPDMEALTNELRAELSRRGGKA